MITAVTIKVNNKVYSLPRPQSCIQKIFGKYENNDGHAALSIV